MAYVPKRPLIAVIGATGTGKSKLAVSLAKRFGGEIINADAMQMYEGLPVVTNKITVPEMCGVRHHLLDRIRLDEETWSVSRFLLEALNVIDGVKSRGKLPILVGGTHYYTQSLLLQAQTLENELHERMSIAEQEEKWPILKGTEEQILEKLQEVDPIMASRWHPNDRRRIRRSLEIWLQTGTRASDLYAGQRHHWPSEEQTVEPSSTSREIPQQNVGLRFDSLTFCTHIEKAELDQRISTRVDQMLEDGLLDEVQLMHTRYKELSQGNSPPDLSRGIWVSIGYKEFLEYLTAKDLDPIDAEALKLLQAKAIERTKTATRQYAKQQMRWIKHKLLPPLVKEGGNTAAVILTCNEPERWSEDVEVPAINLVGEFLSGNPLNLDATKSNMLSELLSSADSTAAGSLTKIQTCEVCGMVITTKDQLEQHPRTARHRRAIRRKRKLDQPNRPPRETVNLMEGDLSIIDRQTGTTP